MVGRRAYLEPGEQALSRLIAERLAPLLEDEPLFAPHAAFAFELEAGAAPAGMPESVRVRDRRWSRSAALRILPAEADAEARALFLREGRLLLRLNDTAIPSPWELGVTSEGRPFMLQPLLEGRTLRELIDAEPGPPGPAALRERMAALAQVARVLGTAHQRGVIHRALCPERVVIGRFGEVSVTGWGLARCDDEAEEIDASLRSILDSQAAEPGALPRTSRGQVLLGIPGYAAPEQLEGGPNDARVDLFALGCLITEAATGSPAHLGETPGHRIAQTIAGAARGPADIAPQLPRDLDNIAWACLARLPAERPRQAALVRAQLEAWCQGERCPEIEYGWDERLGRWLRRRAPILISGLLTLAALAGALYPAFEIYERAESTAQRADKVWADVARLRQTITDLNVASDLQLESAPSKEVLAAVERAMGRGERRAATLTRAGNILVDAGLEDEGRVYLEEAVAHHPPAYDALYSLHWLEVQRQFDPTADFKSKYEPLFRQHDIETYGFSVTERYREAMELLAKREFPEVDKLISEFNDIAPDLPEALYLKWSYQKKFGRYDLASQEAQRLLERHRSPLALTCNAEVEHLFLRYENAVEIWKRHPVYSEHPVYQAGYLKALALAGKLNLAERYLKAYGWSETSAPTKQAYLAIATYNRKKGELSKALQACEQIFKTVPFDAEATLEKVTCLNDCGEYEEALSETNLALERFPDLKSDLTISRATALSCLGRNIEAFNVINNGIRTNNNNINYFRVRGVVLAKLERFPEAIADLNIVLESIPDDPTSLKFRGNSLLLLGQGEDALRDIDRLIRIEGPELAALQLRFSILQSMGRYREAVEQGLSVLRRDPGNRADVHYYTADSFRRLGQADKALELFRSFLVTYPEHEYCGAVRRRIREMSGQ